MLACARIGAAHSVVFGGFSAQSLSIASTTPRRSVITADGGYRRGEVFALKPAADEASSTTPTRSAVVSCVAVATTSRWCRAATSGNTI